MMAFEQAAIGGKTDLLALIDKRGGAGLVYSADATQ